MAARSGGESPLETELTDPEPTPHKLRQIYATGPTHVFRSVDR